MNKNLTENLIRVVLVGVGSLATFLVVSYFNGFITKASLSEIYRPEMFVQKETYQADELRETKEITELKSDLKHIKNNSDEMKQDLKKLLQRVN